MVVVLLLVCALMNFNCSDKSNSVKLAPDEISIDDLKKLSDSQENFYLIDVRTTPELEAGHLSFTDDLIPYDLLDKNRDKLPEDRETVIYLFCRTSRRSGIATDYLRSIGYKNSYNVVGGIVAWQEAGYQIITGPLKN